MTSVTVTKHSYKTKMSTKFKFKLVKISIFFNVHKNLFCTRIEYVENISKNKRRYLGAFPLFIDDKEITKKTC